MHLPKEVQQRLAQDFRFAATQMAQAGNLDGALYFFSAFFGDANRAMNQAWSAELALLHMVTQAAYQHLSQRVAAIAAGADRVIGIPTPLQDALTQAAEDIAGLFEEEEIDDLRLYAAVARIAELSYATSGNGKYLILKGLIKL